MNENSQHAFDSDRALIHPKDDRLMRDGFSQEIAEHIGSWNGQESIVIGINGNWGTGKSTVKNFIKHFLSERERKPTIVDFNPWEWSGQKKLLEGFLSEIGIALGKKDKAKSYRDLARKWKRFADYVQFTATLGEAVKNVAMGVFGTSLIASVTALLATSSIGTLPLIVASVIMAVSAALAFIPPVLSAVVTLLTGQAAFHERSIEDVKDDLTKSLKTLESPVVIFLDDVDRLIDEEIKILFQLVKANCQFPNLIYVVLFEREIVEAALEKIVSGGGRRYLRKIVQHSFDLPHPSPARLRKIIAEDLDKALFKSEIKGVRWNQDRWQNEFADAFFGWFPSIRDAKRFMGSLRFVLSRHSSGGVLEVDPIDLVAIEGIRTMHYDVYRRIASGFHAGGGFESFIFGKDDMEKTFTSEVSSILKLYPDQSDTQAALKTVLESLFPQASHNSSYWQGMEEDWLRDRRVCHPKHFHKYFQLSLDEGDLSAVIIDQVIASSGKKDELSAIFEAAKENGRTLDLFESIFAVRQQIPTENLATLITALFDSGDDLPEDANGFLLVDAEMTCIRIVHHRLKTEPIEVVESALRQAYTDTTGLVLPVRYYALEDKRNRNSSESRGEFLLPESALSEFQEMALSLIRRRADEKSLLELKRCAAIIFRWRDWGKPGEVSIWISNLISKPEYALKLLIRLLSTSYSSQGGKELFLSAKSVESIVSLERLHEKILSCYMPTLSEDEKQAIELLELAIFRKNKGIPYDEVRLKEDW
jgi:predicted KAP-like P-loop ATPase